MLLLTDLIGYIAAFLGAILMLPQVVRTYRLKSAKDLSLIMIAVYLLTTFLWTAYGLLIEALPLVVCNVVAFGIGVFQMGLKIAYSRKL